MISANSETEAPTRVCAWSPCGQPVLSRRSDARFCSDACRAAWNRDRGRRSPTPTHARPPSPPPEPITVAGDLDDLRRRIIEVKGELGALQGELQALRDERARMQEPLTAVLEDLRRLKVASETMDRNASEALRRVEAMEPLVKAVELPVRHEHPELHQRLDELEAMVRSHQGTIAETSEQMSDVILLVTKLTQLAHGR
jgi:hypothetical protein